MGTKDTTDQNTEVTETEIDLEQSEDQDNSDSDSVDSETPEVEESDERDEHNDTESDDSDENDEAETVDSLKKALAKANKERSRLGRKLKEASSTESPEVASWRSAAVNGSARAALVSEGYDISNEKDWKAALRLLDLDEVGVDESGNLTGISEAVAQMKEDFPKLFSTTEKSQDEVTEDAPRIRKPSTAVVPDTKSKPSGMSAASQQLLKNIR